MKVVIIGGNAAGLSAASRLVRRSKDAEAIVYEKTDVVSYGACGLPYYIAGFNDDINLMVIREAGEFIKSGVKLRLKHEVLSVSPKDKSVLARDLQTGREFTQGYDKLLVANGASPIVPPLEGRGLGNVFTLKTLEDGGRVKAALASDQVRTVAVIGGGYIGLELAEAMVARKKKLLLFEGLDRVLNVFDDEFGAAVEKTLAAHGVELHTGETAASLEESSESGKKGKVGRVVTGKGVYDADLVIFAIGVRPNTALFPPDSIAKLPNGALITNAKMETSIPDVYAAGDCATVIHGLLKRPVYLPLGTNANKQGRLVADVMLGDGNARLDRALGTSMLRCLDLELAKTGLSEKDAIANKVNYRSVTVVAPSHAPYYPPSYPLTIKLIYEKDSKALLGAELMGERECALRVNILACAIDRGMTVSELGFADLAYAPPFSYVWDAVQIAANAAK